MNPRGLYLVLLITAFLTINYSAQQMMTISAEKATFLDEIKSIVEEKEGKVIIGFSVGKESRAKEYQQLDIMSDDQVLFINGKKVKSINDFKSEYDSLKAGDEINLGIKRGKERFFVSFSRSDSKLGGGHGGTMKMQTFTSEPGSEGPRKLTVKDGKAIIDGKEINIDSLKKSGRMMMINTEKDTTK